MNLNLLKEKIKNKVELGFNWVKFLFEKIFKKNKNSHDFYEFNIEFQKNSQILVENCDKVLNFLYQIEEKEKLAEKIEINFLTPLHDLIKKFENEKEELSKNLNNLSDFFKNSLKEDNSYIAERLRNKKNSFQFLEKIKLSIFEINECFYKSLKFDEIVDLLELNEEFIKNLSGLDEYNREIQDEKIFNKENTMIKIFDKIEKIVDNFQSKF